MGYTITYRKAWMGKQKAIEKVYGQWEASFEALPQWCAAMCDCVRGSVVQLDAVDAYRVDELVSNVKIFRRVFWTFGPCIRAFRYCKPLVQVDGTHLYGKYKGVLLVAVAQDGNQNILPIAFAIVEGYSRTEHEYNIHYERLRERGEVYSNWLNEIPREKWVLAFDGGHRWGHMTTDLVECINLVLKGARNLPITAPLRATYFRLAELFARKGSEAYARKKAGHIFSEFVTTRLQSNEVGARNLRISQFDRRSESFHVQDLSNRQEYRVDLRQRYCDCGDMHTDRYPCRHVIAACCIKNIDWRAYVDDVYTINKVCKVYKKEFAVIGNENTWRRYRGPKLCPNPSLKRTGKGRPKSTRFLNQMDMHEMRRPKRCSLCRAGNHSRQECPHAARPST
ncbi:uncharacterized protein LOC113859642 [Abrus precatorius]|uniref:Uncharacterized protein LOC113859642 n=1 Tax=Abrus precatorius TaxID=3816 RepID=A0A8B8KW85_ABRPR|nr:uncharacterized protein LOC113859642 [Abrus precatorius]